MTNPTDQLLFAFREAAEREHRLLDLEAWLTSERFEPGTHEHGYRWTVCLMRLLTLRMKRKSLAYADYEAARSYLQFLHDGGAST